VRVDGNAIEEKFVQPAHYAYRPTIPPICPHHQLGAGDIKQDKDVLEALHVLRGQHHKIESKSESIGAAGGREMRRTRVCKHRSSSGPSVLNTLSD